MPPPATRPRLGTALALSTATLLGVGAIAGTGPGAPPAPDGEEVLALAAATAAEPGPDTTPTTVEAAPPATTATTAAAVRQRATTTTSRRRPASRPPATRPTTTTTAAARAAARPASSGGERTREAAEEDRWHETPSTTRAPAPSGGYGGYPGSSAAPAHVSAAIAEHWPAEERERAHLVTWRESRWDERAANSCCHGLFQIHELHQERASRLGYTWEQVATQAGPNAAVAADLHREQGWAPWSSTAG